MGFNALYQRAVTWQGKRLWQGKIGLLYHQGISCQAARPSPQHKVHGRPGNLCCQPGSLRGQEGSSCPNGYLGVVKQVLTLCTRCAWEEPAGCSSSRLAVVPTSAVTWPAHNTYYVPLLAPLHMRPASICMWKHNLICLRLGIFSVNGPPDQGRSISWVEVKCPLSDVHCCWQYKVQLTAWRYLICPVMAAKA